MKKIVAVLSAVLLFATAACAAPSPVGKWQDDTGRKTFEFMADGTVVMSSPGSEIQAIAGKWTNASDGKILMQFSSMYGTIAGYAHFEGGTLVMEDNQSHRMHRVP